MKPYHAKKRFGQNFLNSEKVIARIVELVNPKPNEIIIEVGPGLGALTVPLAQSGAQVWGIEFDRDIIHQLEETLLAFPNSTILNRDFLGFHPEDYKLNLFFLTGNLPYNITSPVIDWCLRYREQIIGAVLMVQKEMAERITGRPGSRSWAPISIFTQIHFDAIHCFDVPPAAFTPQPDVTSAVIRLTPREAIELDNPELFEQVVRASFGQRRKLLINNLVPDFIPDAASAREILKELELPELSRAEELSIPKFIHLTEKISLTMTARGKK